MAVKYFDIGRMRQRVTWQIHDGSETEMNEPTPTGWVTQGECWAEVITDGGVESPNSGQVKGVTRGRIKIRNVGPIKSSDRFLFQGRILDLVSVAREGERNAYLLIEFTEQKVPQ